MKIDIEQVIEFLDNPPKSDFGQATSIIGVIGEDLNANTFKHYLENKENTYVEILPYSVTTGKNKGKRLDRWIYVEKKGEKTLYQCEIKNWAATAISGKRLEKNASKDKKWEIAEKNWENQCKGSFSDPEYPNGVTKVFVKMKSPKGYEEIKVEPLILYWMPISNTPNLNPLFIVPLSFFHNSKINTTFKELRVFSVSIYLRSLLEKGIKYLDYDLPNIKHRLDILAKIFPKS